MHYNKTQDSQYDRRVKDWEEIEELVLKYQEQFTNPNEEIVMASKEAANHIITKFNPLLKKYTTLLRTGNINWSDMESRYFLCLFLDNKDLQKQCRKKYQSNAVKQQILEKFNFIKEMCSKQTEIEIRSDLQMLLLVLAKRYKQVGRNFCSYVYNCFQFEVSRHLKKQSSNPLNFTYKTVMWTEVLQNDIDSRRGLSDASSAEYEYEQNDSDVPDSSWISGETCSSMFADLNPLDRQIIVKYYLEEWKDKQIAKEFCMHINTVNQRRRNAAKKIAEYNGIDINEIKRTRKSGKKAILPIE